MTTMPAAAPPADARTMNDAQYTAALHRRAWRPAAPATPGPPDKPALALTDAEYAEACRRHAWRAAPKSNP